MSAPTAMTMDRVGETKQLIIAQSTSQCCRVGICQPSLNWVIREADNFHGGNPHNEPNVAWIHEESSWIMRCFFKACGKLSMSSTRPTFRLLCKRRRIIIGAGEYGSILLECMHHSMHIRANNLTEMSIYLTFIVTSLS